MKSTKKLKNPTKKNFSYQYLIFYPCKTPPHSFPLHSRAKPLFYSFKVLIDPKYNSPNGQICKFNQNSQFTSFY